MRKTKIVCTLGPASYDERVMADMLKAGMNVARLNFSHGSYDVHERAIETFRRVRDALRCPASILLDTKGPEIRLCRFKNKKAALTVGQHFTLTTREIEGDHTAVSVTYKDLPKKLTKGNTVLLDDGRISLTVEETTDTDILCSVNTGGEISDRKGVNVPHVHLDMPYLSSKDEADLRFAVEHDVDFIAASFVRRKEDVITVRNYLDYYGGHRIKVIAKIENEEGVENFDEILKSADGIMIARGDMGVEIAFEKLPGLQKKFIRRCYRSGKMVITATQMLESMITESTPTRAEITDVANAVFDGTSAIMLSGETAIGKNPPLVVEVMAKIAEQAETDSFALRTGSSALYENDGTDTKNAICDASCTVARDIGAAAIITMTKTGATAKSVSKFRPAQPIVAATPDVKTYHQLAMSWGVYPVVALYQNDEDSMYRHAAACAKMAGFVHPGDSVVITAGDRGATALRIQTI